jgi:predicted ATP-dependent protease
VSVEPLPASALHTPCDPASLGFATTADLEPIEDIVLQDRAVEAVEFAIGMRREGYNLFVQGPEGSGRSTLLRQALGAAALRDPVPDDWCYVHSFDDPQHPRAIRLPAGRGRQLRDALSRLVAELRVALPAAFDSEAYRNRREALEASIRERRDAALQAFDARAHESEVTLLRTPLGVGLAMTRGDEVLPPDEFRTLPPDEQERRRRDMARLEADLEVIVRHLPSWEKEGREQLAALDREVVRTTATPLVEAVREAFADIAEVIAHLVDLEADIVAHTAEFVVPSGAGETAPPPALRALMGDEGSTLRRYAVNLIVDHAGDSGAPVVYEPNPTFGNLLGRVEHLTQLGGLVTDFSLIRSGALHRSNGGYLLLDARKVLMEPLAWDGLKRALRAGELRVEPVARALALVDSVTLEPAPIPLAVKVALIGERRIYDLLVALDPEFPELFKVAADFDDRVERTPVTDRVFARVIAAMSRRDQTRALDATAVARLVEHLARLAGDRERLSTHMRGLNDLVMEADHAAGAAGRAAVSAVDVDAAIEARRRRVGRRRELLLDAIRTGSLIVATDGEAIGQVNGLSIHQLGDESFGWPTRITARARLGGGEVIDIEREVELGGPLHSKGVLILAGFLGGRYAVDRPLSLRASLVFEQSYGGVEGDSASLAELCALLSAIGEVPIRQSLAITGSVDQWGRVQPIGGANEKVEGFFDVCLTRGLSGDQGVVLPDTNVRNLMLRADVVAAVEAGRFRLWAVGSVDEALELLTGRPVAEVDAAVKRRLAAFAAAARETGAPKRQRPPTPRAGRSGAGRRRSPRTSGG